jgi:D-3-phosphoglycerate dehydrogenase / 2-oxoglutarate reductase
VIVISEDVWSEGFANLAKTDQIVHEPDLWSRRDDLKAYLASATALVVRNRTKVDQELFSAAPNLKIVARAGVGLDNIDIETADQHNVVICAALGINATAVAEHTLGLALALLRKIVELDKSTRSGQWNRKAGGEISGKVWGLLGFGATAKAVANLLKGFGCKVIAYDPFAKPDAAFLQETNASLLSLDEVIKNSDILSIHMPATNETTNLLDLSQFKNMKKSAIVINVGRGEVINENDLELALKDGIIAGAGLDVRVIEPVNDKKFIDLDQVILTPHVAGITHESQAKINQILVSEIKRAIAGELPEFAVGKTKTFK